MLIVLWRWNMLQNAILPAAIAAGRATESVVSSLAAPSAPDTIPRNYGFATAVGAGQPAGTNTIRACVAEDQTVTTGA